MLRLDIASGKFENFEPYKIPRPNVYDVIPDSQNNGFFTVLGSERTSERSTRRPGRSRSTRRRLHGSGPRRGMMDSQDRLWFGENSADRIGMFDTQDRAVPGVAGADAGAWPYDVTVGQERRSVVRRRVTTIACCASIPKTGQFIEYLLPAQDEHSKSLRRQFDDAGHVLGGQQPRRLHRQAGAARGRSPQRESLKLRPRLQRAG